MVENKTFNNIPKEILSANEIQLLDILLEADVIFKEDQVVKKGFLSECTEVLSFTFDEFRDFCITHYLMRKADAEKSFPIVWDLMCKEHWSVLEGVEKYIFFMARTTVKHILPIIKTNSNYQRMYWENVWNLEDSDLCDSDITEWKEQFEQKGPYRKPIINYLLLRSDRHYFRNVTIDLLFEIMDDMAKKPGEYDDFIRTFFPLLKTDKYNQEIYQKDHVLYCDQTVKSLVKSIEKEADYINYYDSLKLTIYLYGIMPVAIKNLWGKALPVCFDEIMKIVDDFLQKERIAVVIKSNLEDIFEYLMTISADERIRELYLKCHDKPRYQSVNQLLDNIWS